MTTTAKDYYTVAQAAKRLSVPTALIWQWIEDGDLPARRTGPRSAQVDRAAIEAVITPREQRSLSIAEVRERLAQPLTAEELARRRIYWSVVREHRKHRPSIAPLTTADLVHMGRRPEYDRSADPD